MGHQAGTDAEDADTFARLRDQRGLRKFLSSDPGTLYFAPDDLGPDQVLVRHFDGGLDPSFAADYAAITRGVGDWVTSHPDVAALVDVQPVVHVGEDYVSRPYRVYWVSTDTYAHPDDGIPPPDELASMRAAVAASLDGPVDTERDAVVSAVAGRTLLEPSGRVYFDETRRRFVVVEPKVTGEDVARWTAASRETGR